MPSCYQVIIAPALASHVIVLLALIWLIAAPDCLTMFSLRQREQGVSRSSAIYTV
jgi:hypothetical protein